MNCEEMLFFFITVLSWTHQNNTGEYLLSGKRRRGKGREEEGKEREKRRDPSYVPLCSCVNKVPYKFLHSCAFIYRLGNDGDTALKLMHHSKHQLLPSVL